MNVVKLLLKKKVTKRNQRTSEIYFSEGAEREKIFQTFDDGKELVQNMSEGVFRERNTLLITDLLQESSNE